MPVDIAAILLSGEDMPKFRKKPLIIEAVRLTRPVIVQTLEGAMRGNPGDWLITGVKGEQYICRDDVFRATYEPCDDEAANMLSRTDDVGQ